MAAENQKPKHGSISFDVILKPAQTGNSKPLQLSPREPVKKREHTQEQINNKLKKAEQRRSLLEQERMEQLAKERQKALEVMNKNQCEVEKFSQKTKEKLRRSMEKYGEAREQQIRFLQDRLREHSLRVQEVQNAGEEMVREFEAKSEEKLSKKMETYEENRQNQLRGMLTKLKEHPCKRGWQNGTIALKKSKRRERSLNQGTAQLTCRWNGRVQGKVAVEKQH
ncbi:stathmin [Elysia marginata]|uniref:Stathmin n=1 Tax=Elysia marginata TaxID=1093978 RepID=A0AAV4JRN9_9GAST|nr:stathmin [Elysia marginata]